MQMFRRSLKISMAGGHKRAAGLSIDGELENVIMSVVEATISEIRGND